jgi:hypothetical protein
VSHIDIEDELLTRDDLAARLKVCVRTIDLWKRRGKIPAVIRGRKFTRYIWRDVVSALRDDAN